jgi:3-isopropylmalate dehydrogenase
MMFRYSLGLEAEALAIENAVRRVLDDKSVGGYGMLTKDLGGGSSTTEIGAAVVRALTEELAKLNSGKL